MMLLLFLFIDFGINRMNINIMKISNLNEEVGYYKFLHYIYIYKMCETTYYQRIRETILNRAKDYYPNNKEIFREKAKHKYRELSEEKNI